MPAFRPKLISFQARPRQNAVMGGVLESTPLQGVRWRIAGGDRAWQFVD